MIKWALLVFLAVVSTHAFAPIPALRVQRPISETTSKSIIFMAPPLTEEKVETETPTEIVNGSYSIAVEIPEEEEQLSQSQKLMKQVKESGTAGIVSYALWELAFWFFSVPVCVFGYREVTGHWPDLSNTEDLEKLGAEAFAFVNFARFAVPLRIGLALSTTGWIQENVIDRFQKGEGETSSEEQIGA